MDIGLKRGTVKLVPHNSRWKELFIKERDVLISLLPDLLNSVEHAGSTAIAGIYAKPIIDIYPLVDSLDQIDDDVVSKMESIGYEYKGAHGVPGRRLFVKGPEECRTHHVQFMEEDGEEWSKHRLFRDYLLENGDVAEEYSRLKLRLGEKFSNDRGSYLSGKSEFIESVIERAK